MDPLKIEYCRACHSSARRNLIDIFQDDCDKNYFELTNLSVSFFDWKLLESCGIYLTKFLRPLAIHFSSQIQKNSIKE